MQKINHCYVEFDLEFGTVNDKFLSLSISAGDHSIDVYPELVDGKFLARPRLYIDLPTVVKLNFSGKDPTVDVVMDLSGKIVQDLYVKILKVNIDGFELNEKFIHQGLTINTVDGESWTTSYIGFNGEIKIDLAQPNVFLQYNEILNR